MSNDLNNPYRPPGSTPPQETEVQEPVEPQNKKIRGSILGATIAWIVITLVVAFQIAEPYLFKQEASKKAVKSGLVMLELQGKYLVGFSELALPDANNDLGAQLGVMDFGPIENRYCHTVMINELVDAATAQKQLDQIDELITETNFEPSEDQAAVGSLLRQLYSDYQNEAWEAPSISQQDRDFLVNQLGWFGTLVLNGENSPSQAERKGLTDAAKVTMFALIGIVLLFMFAGFAGFVGLIIFTVLLVMGKLQLRTENFTGNGRIYIEAFAIWFILFIGLQIAMYFVVVDEFYRLIGALIVSFCSLSCLAWPVVRGVPVSEMLSDVGLKCKNVLVEILTGIMCYVCTIPILVCGGILTIILSAIFGTPPDPSNLMGEPPSHPIMEWVSEAGVMGFIVVGLLTAVSAPIVEETVFRGLLYRHFRDASHRYGRLLSSLLSGVMNGLIFAAIHPQGVFAIPVLTALAFSFSLVREWRGSLYAPMTMHSVHNGMLTLGLFMVFVG